LAVGPQGAGVSFAGRGKASIGEFTITANGTISVDGGSIEAEKSVKIVAPSIEVINAATSASISSISGATTLLANAGDITITGSVTGVRRDATDPVSKGGVTLRASGNIDILTQNSSQLAIVFASSDDLSATAGGNISNDTGRLLSNGRVLVTAGGTFSNTEDIIGAVAGGASVTQSYGKRPWCWAMGQARKIHDRSLERGLAPDTRSAGVSRRLLSLRDGRERHEFR
jgi:hypothetical protein